MYDLFDLIDDPPPLPPPTFMATASDWQSATSIEDYAAAGSAAADVDGLRRLIRWHELATHCASINASLRPIVGPMPWGYRGFCTLTPEERRKLAAASPRLAELIRQGDALGARFKELYRPGF